MRFLLGLLFILCISQTYGGEVVTYTHYDIDTLVKKLAKPFDLERTIRTIIKIESNDGEYLVNLSDPSCGITHININTYLRRHNILNTSFNRNKACQKLINNPKLAIANAIEELLFWKQYHCKTTCNKEQYKNVIKSYNAGYSYTSNQAKEYYDKFFKAYKHIYK